MKKIFALLMAVGVVGSAFAADDDVLPDPLDGKDPRNITMSIHDLVHAGYIKPKDGVKIAWTDKTGYLVLNEKTGSLFMFSKDYMTPVLLKGRVAQNDEWKHLVVGSSVLKYLDECGTKFDEIKKAECMLNLAATF